jgi:dihydrofolate reductase
MAELVFAAITSLDGYVADDSGNFDWAAPDETVHAFVNDLQRSIGTYLYGRRMYDVMQVWQTMPASDSAAMNDYAEIWRAADKVVYSTTLTEPSTPRTRIERSFDPDAIRRLKESAATDISIAGPDLAAQAIRAGLVDQIGLFLNPIIVGTGNAALPRDVVQRLDLIDERRFASGVVYLSYRVTGGS